MINSLVVNRCALHDFVRIPSEIVSHFQLHPAPPGDFFNFGIEDEMNGKSMFLLTAAIAGTFLVEVRLWS
jgi:hypothetical protein